jgi:hypothetical protein
LFNRNGRQANYKEEVEIPMTMTLKNQIKTLIALNESSGWSTLNEVMKEEVLQLALSMAR